MSETLDTFVKKFWANPANVEAWKNPPKEPNNGSNLALGNVALMSRCITWEEESIARRIKVGLPVVEFKSSRGNTGT